MTYLNINTCIDVMSNMSSINSVSTSDDGSVSMTLPKDNDTSLSFII